MYDVINTVIEKVNYKKHSWYTKYCFFYLRMGQPSLRSAFCSVNSGRNKNLTTGEKKTKHYVSLVKPGKIFLLPFTSSWDWKKSVEKAMKKECQGFLFIKQKFPKINIEEGIFLGPQITELVRNEMFNSV